MSATAERPSAVASDPAEGRTATVVRKTKETDIEVSLNLDGSGAYDISTGIGFLSLLVARHAAVWADLHVEMEPMRA